jgi:hypothetical protein
VSTALLATLPWVLAMAAFVARVRLPRALPAAPAADRAHSPGAAETVEGAGDRDRPLVSVVVPARNEVRNIERVLRTLAASRGVDFDIVVVDDRSDDGTAERARGVAAEVATAPTEGALRGVRVLDGAPLPDGWLGKNWACWQGAAEARGDLLLFTDADTVHGPQLLARAVAGLEEDGADCVTLAGRQLMESFWERLVQPQIFVSMLTRYANTRDPLEPEEWRSAIANGQYILIRRRAYERLGGHEALRGEVVEDMRMAQRMVRGGMRLSVRAAEDDFATRMYTGLRELVEGWSKNIVIGGLATLPEGWVRRLAPPAGVILGTLVWLLPPLVALVGLASVLVDAPVLARGGPPLQSLVLAVGASPVLLWAVVATGVSALFWMLVTWRMHVPALYGILYPLGAAVANWIFVRAWLRGGTVEWKGRRYAVEPEALAAEPDV